MFSLGDTFKTVDPVLASLSPGCGSFFNTSFVNDKVVISICPLPVFKKINVVKMT